MKEVFPNDIMKHTAELYYFRFSSSGKAIYWSLLLLITGAVISLPFIEIDVYHSARGMIRSESERQSLINISPGRVLYSSLHPNSEVKKGDTVLIIDHAELAEQLAVCRLKQVETNSQISDLEHILRFPGRLDSIYFHTGKYTYEYREYLGKLGEQQSQIRSARQDVKRISYLFKRGAISAADHELRLKTLDLNIRKKEIFKNGQITKWHSELLRLKEIKQTLRTTETQLLKSIQDHVLIAGTDGNLMNVRSQEVGSLITAGITVAEISPDNGLLVECYIPPTDIGLIRESGKVSFRVDTFNYNRWGILSGVIEEIPNDVEFINGDAVFKIRCRLDRAYLKLKNGFIGKVSKGMTLTAEFHLSQRTIWQLIFDQADNWLSHSQMKIRA